MKLLMEDWRKYLTEQEEIPPEQAASEELPAITDQTSFKVFDKNPRLAAKVMIELLKGGEYFQQLQAAQAGQWYAIKSAG